MNQAKAKISVTLSPAVLRRVDRAVREGEGPNRSAVIERWLERASAESLERELERQTITCYTSLSAAEQAEEDELSRASSRAARRLALDER